MTILYSNGCSHTANFDLPRNSRYPLLLSKKLGWNCVDNAEPGASNARIFRTTIKDCVRLKNTTSEKIFALIQLTYLHRTEIPDFNAPNPDKFISLKPSSFGEKYNKNIIEYLDLYFRFFDDSSLATYLMTNVIMLSSFFKQQSIDYLIYFGPEHCDSISWNSQELFSHIQQDSNILDFRTFFMLGLTDTPEKHPTADGMKNISEYFYKLIVRRDEPK